MNSPEGIIAVPLRSGVQPARFSARRHSVFHVGMAVVMCLIVFVGFGPSFYLRAYFQSRFGGVPPLPSRLVVVHGIAFSGWMVLLLLQTLLVSARRIQWHRRVGVAGAIIAAVMVVVGVAAQVAQTHRIVVSGDYEKMVLLENGLTIGALLNVVIFGALVAAAIHFRLRPDFHRRLVLLATLPLLPAAIGRIVFNFALPPVLNFFVLPAFIIALLISDLRAIRRVHPATFWGSLPIVASVLLPLTALPGSVAGSAFTRWVATLP
jgi:hypothetical protein